ncbi:MAG: hypothetical protein HY238_23020 [Acidobacteria bacterium]|nr:hypothetical protein [Acidobacteriota bacterium]
MNRTLILAGGFAGVYTALHLEKIFARDEDIEITLIPPIRSKLCRAWVCNDTAAGSSLLRLAAVRR